MDTESILFPSYQEKGQTPAHQLQVGRKLKWESIMNDSGHPWVWLICALSFFRDEKDSQPTSVVSPHDSSMYGEIFPVELTVFFLFSNLRTLIFILWFFLRKISPELTAANTHLFAEEDWPWANIHAHLPLLYMWDAYHRMAFKQCHVRTQDLNQRTLGCWEAEHTHLNTAPPGWPPIVFFFL